MELIHWLDTLIVEIPLLWECLKTSTFPASFLQNALGLSPEQIASLPRNLMIFVAVYFLCALITVALRFAKKQQSLNSSVRQITNAILTICCTLFIPALFLLGKAAVYVLKYEVAPYQGAHDFVRFAGQSFGSIIYILMAFGGIFFTVLLPLGAAFRYLKVYYLRGLPHMIFDLGTGPLLVAVWLLVTIHGEKLLYLLIPAALILLTVVQSGGYIAEEVNTRAAQLQQEPESAYGKSTKPTAAAAQSTEEAAPAEQETKM